eukprot:jgi/Botrbrau1/22158/Bobra.0206s0081.1
MSCSSHGARCQAYFDGLKYCPWGQHQVLEELMAQNCKLPALIMDHRKLKKFEEFVSALQCRARMSTDVVLVSDEPGRKLVRIRGTFCQTKTQTGRLAMDEPNLQNIPKNWEFDILPTQASQDSQSREVRCHEASIRSAFVAPPGFVLLSADYRQIELRMMAHLSGDQGLCSLLCQTHTDPFRMLAAKWLQLDPPQVAAVQREHAKRLAYGILYGMGANALATQLDCSSAAASRMRDDFLASIPAVVQFQQKVFEGCRKLGYVSTLSGRRRPLPSINSRQPRERAEAERKAFSTVCQGSAADLIKTAMTRLLAASQRLFPGALRLILMIHDELLFEVREDVLPHAAEEIRRQMEAAMQLDVPTPIHLRVGRSWGALEPYQ